MPKKLTTEERQKRQEEKNQLKELVKVKKDCLERLLKPNTLNKFTWAREQKIINQLYDKFPNINFWRGFSLDFKLNSAAWLLTENGKDKLNEEYRRQTTDLSQLINKRQEQEQKEEIETEIVEKVEIQKKVLTLKDFLK